jgi:hypothetical protein
MPRIVVETLALTSLPHEEDESFEFKSSRTPPDKLKGELSRAGSAFANTGGGCLVAGLGNDGKADGGLPRTISREPLRDWIDATLQSIVPPIQYDIKMFDDAAGRGYLETGKTVAAIVFAPSENAPHMSGDKRYYIRAGAHTVPSPHFLVEALWSRRRLSRPFLVHALRPKPGNPDVVQVGVVSVSDTPAIDVEMSITPIADDAMTTLRNHLPRRLPVVDRNTPFFMDVTFYGVFDHDFTTETAVVLKYRDIAGNQYEYRSSMPLREAINPIQLGIDPAERIARAIGELKRG